MSKHLTDQTLALAGLFQAAALVDHTARRGTADPTAFEVSIRSLFARDPDTTLDVYGDLTGLRLGLQVLILQLSGQEREVEITRYVLTLLHLERKLHKRRDLLNTISEGLQQAEHRLQHFPLTHDNILAGLAELYSNTVSTLPPRIMVNGEQGHLQHAEVQARVRALLLAGMRSAVLWRQNGGNRLVLLLRRKAILEEARRLQAQILH